MDFSTDLVFSDVNRGAPNIVGGVAVEPQKDSSPRPERKEPSGAPKPRATGAAAAWDRGDGGSGNAPHGELEPNYGGKHGG